MTAEFRAGHGPPLLCPGVVARPAWTGQDVVIATGLALLAAALRLPGLDQGLWIDEILTLVHSVRLPPMEIIRGAQSLNNHVLYSLGAHFSIAAFGESAWALRLPALLFGVAAVPAAYHLGRQIASRPEAFLASLFLALNYQHVWFSQNARGYTGLLFGAVVATILFIRLLGTRNPAWQLVVGYAIVVSLSAWLHLIALAVPAAHGLIWVALARNRARNGSAAAAWPSFQALCLAGVLALAVNVHTLRHVGGFAFKNWAMDADVPAGVRTELPAETEIALLSDGMRWTFAEFAEGLSRSMPGGWAVPLVLVAVLAAGTISYARQGYAVLALLLLPLLVSSGVVAASNLLIYPRFLFGTLVFLLLVGVRGGFVLSAKCLPFLSRRYALAAGIAVALAGTTKLPAAWQPKQDWPAVAAFLARQSAPDDAVACLGWGAKSSMTGYLGIACEPAHSRPMLESLERRYTRIWVVYAMPQFTARWHPEVWEALHAKGAYRLVREFGSSVSGGEIGVLVSVEGAGEADHDD